MPTYHYRCDDCAHEFEEFQPISEPPIEVCPACGFRTRRVISGGAGLLFKGNGFYITDYRSDSYKKAADRDKSSPGKKDDAKSTPAKDPGASSTKKPSDS